MFGDTLESIDDKDKEGNEVESTFYGDEENEEESDEGDNNKLLISKENLLDKCVKERKSDLEKSNEDIKEIKNKTLDLECNVETLKINSVEQKAENYKIKMLCDFERIKQRKKYNELELKIEKLINNYEKQEKEIKELRQEIKDLKNINEKQAKEIKELRQEIKDLKNK